MFHLGCGDQGWGVMCMKRAVCCEGHSSAFFLPFGWVSLPVKATLEQPTRLRWMWIEPMMEISRHTCQPICWLLIHFFFFLQFTNLLCVPEMTKKCTLQYPRLRCDISNSLIYQWSVSIITVFFCEGILTEWEVRCLTLSHQHSKTNQVHLQG